jgi:hypothetical protein
MIRLVNMTRSSWSVIEIDQPFRRMTGFFRRISQRTVGPLNHLTSKSSTSMIKSAFGGTCSPAPSGP